MALEDLHTYQREVREWCLKCFGADVTANVIERAHRFFEEAAELCQSLYMSRADADALLDYVYSRPPGNTFQEVGGTMVTLSALASAVEIELDRAAIDELMRILGKVDEIRAKHATKPRGSPLPGKTPESPKAAPAGPQVVSFPRTNLNDLPTKLRELATRLETEGDEVHGATSMLIAVPRQNDWPVIIGFGDQTDEFHPVVVANQIVQWMTFYRTRRNP